MGKLIELAPTQAAMQKRMHAARKRLNRIEGLAFEVEMALAKCCEVVPPKSRRELIDILRYFASKNFPLDERSLRAAKICLQIKLEQYAAAA
jgi:hypothetical protein